MDDTAAPTSGYGTVPMDVLAAMPGINFVRSVFDGRLPQPPIMRTIEPFDGSAAPGVIVMHAIPALRHYNPIGSVHGGYTATLLDSAMGLAAHSRCAGGSGYTTLEFKVSFIRAMTAETGTVRTRRAARCRSAAAPRRRGKDPGCQGPPARARHHHLSRV